MASFHHVHRHVAGSVLIILRNKRKMPDSSVTSVRDPIIPLHTNSYTNIKAPYGFNRNVTKDSDERRLEREASSILASHYNQRTTIVNGHAARPTRVLPPHRLIAARVNAFSLTLSLARFLAFALNRGGIRRMRRGKGIRSQIQNGFPFFGGAFPLRWEKNSQSMLSRAGQ